MFLLNQHIKTNPRPSQIHTSASRSLIKSFFFSLSLLTEGTGLFFEPAVSENAREIVLSAAAMKRRVITNSNGCFYINESL